MATNFEDNLQHRLSQAEDEILRLFARVAALESGTPLPHDQVIAVMPQPQPVIAAVAETVTQPQPTTIPDISEGWAGSRRGF